MNWLSSVLANSSWIFLFAASGTAKPTRLNVFSPDSPEAQIKNAFGHVATILKLAGGSPADVVKITVHLKDKAMREMVNQEWIKMFPDEKDRPVRHTLSAPDLPGGNIIQLEMMAVLEKA